MFCKYCGAELDDQAYMCIHCGMKVATTSASSPTFKAFNSQSSGIERKKSIAFLLAIFFGYLGLHQFYLGYSRRGLIMLSITLFGSCFLIGPIITAVWSIVDAVMIISGTRPDAQGKQLK
ncbi:MAG: TM2 domain-containing protein [Erysipelotrichaceae bacterium]